MAFFLIHCVCLSHL